MLHHLINPKYFYIPTSNLNLTSSTNPKIQLKKILHLYTNHFKNNLDFYTIPLLLNHGLLNYTAKFAQAFLLHKEKQSTLNQENVFRQIKKSIQTAKKFTPSSCLHLTQALNKYQFIGDEELILQKIQNYAENNHLLFTNSQIKDFNLAYKCIMVDKAFGSVKFRPFQLKQTQQQIKLKMRINRILQNSKFPKSKYSFHYSSNQYIFFFEKKIFEKTLKLKLITTERLLNLKNENEIKTTINKQIENYESILFVSAENNNNLEFPKRTGYESILKKVIDSYTQNKIQDKHHESNLLRKYILLSQQSTSKQIHSIHPTLSEEIKVILNTRTQSQINQLFGYVTLINFHAKFQNYTHLYTKLQNHSLSCSYDKKPINVLQSEELIQFGVNTRYERIKKDIFRHMLSNNINSTVIYLPEQDFLPLLTDIVQDQLLPVPIKERQIINAENSQNDVIQRKRIMLSLLYGLRIPEEFHSEKEKMLKLIQPQMHELLRDRIVVQK